MIDQAFALKPPIPSTPKPELRSSYRWSRTSVRTCPLPSKTDYTQRSASTSDLPSKSRSMSKGSTQTPKSRKPAQRQRSNTETHWAAEKIYNNECNKVHTDSVAEARLQALLTLLNLQDAGKLPDPLQPLASSSSDSLILEPPNFPPHALAASPRNESPVSSVSRTSTAVQPPSPRSSLKGSRKSRSSRNRLRKNMPRVSFELPEAQTPLPVLHENTNAIGLRKGRPVSGRRPTPYAFPGASDYEENHARRMKRRSSAFIRAKSFIGNAFRSRRAREAMWIKDNIRMMT